MTKVISKFENLPNELLLDIFTYCRPRDLFISLFNLNQRLNTLIYLQSLGVDLGNALPKYLLDIHYQSVLPNAREQIISLRLSDTYNRMKRFVANDDDLGIEFETRKAILQHVRCLILWDPTMNSLYEALKYVNNLESFHLTSIGRARQTPNYSDSLLKILFQMKTLKRLYLALHDSIIYNTDIDINTSITHLVLNGCHMQHFGPLLRHLPNIQTLNIMCYNRPNLLSWTHQNFDHSLYDGLSERIPYLTNLTLHVTHTPFFEIEVILRQLPKLIKFSFSSLLIEDYSNGANWERVITNSLPVLNKFCLFINETHVPLRTPIDLDKMIESFSSPFWYRWPVVIEYYNEGFSKRHLMLYTLPMQKDSVRTYLYGAQTYSTQKSVNTNDPVENEERKNDYKKVYELHFVLHPSPPANVLLPNRVYTNLKSLSFTSELTDPRSYDCDVVLTDLQKLFSSSILANIKRIYLYNQIYPNNFFSKLLNILPNVQSVRVPDALLYISTVSPRITSLTIDFTSSSVVSNFTDILRQMGTYLLNLRYLYLELKDAQNIYIFLAYCLRKLQHLLDIHLAFHETNACIDQQTFLTWFTDYKSLNALNSKVQVEFSDKNNRLHISL